MGITMLLRRPLLRFISTTFLALFATSGFSSAQSPSESDSPTGRPATLFNQLCELNENWREREISFGDTISTAKVDDEVRLIQTHLRLVHRQLSDASVDHLDDSLRIRRAALLDTLYAYMEEGQFPQNVFVSGRRPVFIDPWGVHCAVGHLIAASGHPRLAKRINDEHQLCYLRDITTAGLENWQQRSGFSFEELALIQPSYHFRLRTRLNYPEDIESLILGDSSKLIAALENGERDLDDRCGGKTILHFAAAAGDLKLVKLLFEKGANLNALSRSGLEHADTATKQMYRQIKVQWGHPTTAIGPNNTGYGVTGAVFNSVHGRFIADVLSDVRGGVAGLNALDYAMRAPVPSGLHYRTNGSVIGVGFGKHPSQRVDPLKDLKQNRAAVAAWLQSQGLTKTKAVDH